MSYEQATHFAQTWGLVLLAAGFVIAVAFIGVAGAALIKIRRR